MIEPAPYPADRPRAAAIRSRLMLQVADHLITDPGWSRRQAFVELRRQGEPDSAVRLWGSDSPHAVLAVARGLADVAIVNPATAALPALIDAGLAVAGSAGLLADGSEAADLGAVSVPPVAAIATVPSYDQMGFAVRADLGISTLSGLVAARPKIRLSLRAQRDHAVHQFVGEALAAAGCTLDDVARWGGSVHDDPGLPHQPQRRPLVEGGERDAVFDEGVYNWGEDLLEREWVFLEVDPPVMARLEARGYRRAFLTPARFPTLRTNIQTVDFSGFMICVRTDADDELVTSFCAALVARAGQIPWQGGPTLPLAVMWTDAPDAPLCLPLHRAARAFWRRWSGNR